jgi:hypothetical protein
MVAGLPEDERIRGRRLTMIVMTSSRNRSRPLSSHTGSSRCLICKLPRAAAAHSYFDVSSFDGRGDPRLCASAGEKGNNPELGSVEHCTFTCVGKRVLFVDGQLKTNASAKLVYSPR